ncbi:DUF2569 domain-containing protein [Erythrobacter gaetbuli]|uniref:DUF2569 domain-containing protein n=1 Tax=Qipengyuania gaetbuli TaxID=266952 RepID=A0A844Y3Q4_9SPHN|nr:DUF2569 domain-containing protein [Qipengyuania gaetbuli]MXO52159.1 DUF2569 domain-containing protein [Qipengyuania gaetbuli]
MIRRPANAGGKLTVSPFPVLAAWFARWKDDLHLRSVALTTWIENHLGLLAFAWLALMASLLTYKVSRLMVPVHGAFDMVQLVLPYIFIALAPIAGFMIGRAAFLHNRDQPEYRLALFGNWRELDRSEAQAHPSFGPTGFLTSLVVGMVFGVAIRTGEFLVIMPALNQNAPEWAFSLFIAMSLEVAAMNFFYMVCFVMALRTVPLFPRMLGYVWILDLLSKLMLARIAGGLELPASIGEPLSRLLTTNVHTVLISVAIWLPYLILSERVNVTFRHRVSSEVSKA